MLQLLPGGPDQSPALSDLLSRRAAALAAAERLVSRCVPRPAPPQYLGLQQEVAGFARGLGRPERLLALAASLAGDNNGGSSSAGGPQQLAAALQEADMWASGADSWAARLGAAYPAYSDVTQPVRLAVAEACHGLAVLRAAAEARGSGSGGGGASVHALTAGLLSFPTPTGPSSVLLSAAAGARLQPVAPPSALADASLQAAAGALVSSTAAQLPALQRHPGAAARAAEIAAYTWRLQSARAALHATVGDALLAAPGGAGGVTGGGSHSVAAAVARADALFRSFLLAWRKLREYEARAAEEKEQMFKSKSKVQSSVHLTEEVRGRMSQ
jgi:hypothetical protein